MSLLSLSQQLSCSSGHVEQSCCIPKDRQTEWLEQTLQKPKLDDDVPQFHLILVTALALVLSRHTNQSAIAVDFVRADDLRSHLASGYTECRFRGDIDESDNVLRFANSLQADATVRTNPEPDDAHVVLLALCRGGRTTRKDHQSRKLRGPHPDTNTERDLMICLYPHNDSFRVSFSCVANFPIVYVRTLVEHFLHATNHLLRPRALTTERFCDVKITNEAEENLVLRESYPRHSIAQMRHSSIHQAFRAQAKATPDATALLDYKHRSTTFHQADIMSDHMSILLFQQVAQLGAPKSAGGFGVGDAHVVAIMLSRSPNFIISQLACWKAGFAVVILDPDQPAVRNKFMAEDSEATLVLIDNSCDLLQWAGHNIWQFDFEHLREITCSTSLPKVKASSSNKELEYFHRLAWIQYTSGSTGTPKGVRHSHASMLMPMIGFDVSKSSMTLLFLNPVSAGSSMPIWTFLLNGKGVCILPPSMLKVNLESCINDFGIDHIAISPSALAILEPSRVPRLKTLTTLGESIPRSLITKWLQVADVRTHYGSTEVGSHNMPTCNDAGHLPPVLPLPISDCSIYIMRPGTNEPCPFFVPGEICVSATYMISGYTFEGQSTTTTLHAHPFPENGGHQRLYRTGDLGVLIGGSKFAVLGRVDRQIKIDGNRIEPGEIEHLVCGWPCVKAAKVILVKLCTGLSVLVCCVVLNDTSQYQDLDWSSLVEELSLQCQRHLPLYMMPHRWVRLEGSMPLTVTGKVDLKGLEQLVKEKFNEVKQADSHRDDAMFADAARVLDHISEEGKVFTEICLRMLTNSCSSNLLRVDSESIMSKSFLFSGGTSLIAMRIVHEMKIQKIGLTLEMLYSSARLVDICRVLSKSSKSSRTNHRVHEDVKVIRSYPLPSNLDIRNDDIESVFPASTLQCEMMMLSMRNSCDWCLYQYLDLSQHAYNRNQIQEALQILMESKPILRTVIVPAQTTPLPPSNAVALTTMHLTCQQNLVHVVKRAGASQFLFSKTYGAVEAERHFMHDKLQGWGLGQPLWRAAWMEETSTLALVLHHTLTDRWTHHFLVQDLYQILTAIVERDADTGCADPKKLIAAIIQARRPSMQNCLEAHYAGKGLDGNDPCEQMLAGTRLWKDVLAGAAATYLPDTGPQFPVNASAGHSYVIHDLTYPVWCQQHGVTAGALFTTAFAMALALVIGKWHELEEVTYYRYLSIRDSSTTLWDAEGGLISMCPFRIPMSADSTLLGVVRAALSFATRTQPAQPYYIDENLTPGGALGMRRPFGNILFNHFVQRSEVNTTSPFPDKTAGQGYLTDTPAFLAAEFHLTEFESRKGTRLEVHAWSHIADDSLIRLLDYFERILEGIIIADPEMHTGLFLDKVSL